MNCICTHLAKCNYDLAKKMKKDICRFLRKTCLRVIIYGMSKFSVNDNSRARCHDVEIDSSLAHFPYLILTSPPRVRKLV